ncbi:transporter [Sphingomonas sp.]|uniref:transporter n=1 Tax=Sphingomonas sp. TaxID=28214 RepID=UPI0025ED6441|nr:transporter [Sphingomonas sp.]MBV9528551.1 transporter [Sphingomonas sp.]
MSPLLALAATAAAQLPPICTDRPSKANAVCTVPAGHWQVEASIADWTLTKAGGTRTTVLAIAPTTVKYGLTDHSDLELTVVPFARSQTTGEPSFSGAGDLLVRYKQRLTHDSAPVQVTAIPFVKIPVAKRGLGNGKGEGGIAMPVSFNVAGPVIMTLGPEADWLADGDGDGRHLAVVNLVNLAGSIAPRLTLDGELWTNLNFDPAGTIRQASVDVAAAYAWTDYLQLDGGANFGLTRNTPDLELYSGFSIRF